MEQEYQDIFMRRVHLVGRSSMVIGLLLSFLPVIYLYFFKGYRADASSYFQVIFAVVAYGLSLWLTEPLSYYPILGSAGTYMAYLSGNVGNMRAPVAMAVQSSMKEEVTTPRGNIGTIITIAISVFVNIIILAAIIYGGTYLLKVLPQDVLDAFAYTLAALYASMITMRTVNNPKRALSYMPVTIILFYIAKNIAPLKRYTLAICIAGTILFAYLLFIKERSKLEANGK